MLQQGSNTAATRWEITEATLRRYLNKNDTCGDVVAPASVEAASTTIADIHAPPRQHTPELPSVAETSGTPWRQPSITNDPATDAITNVQSLWAIRPMLRDCYQKGKRPVCHLPSSSARR